MLLRSFRETSTAKDGSRGSVTAEVALVFPVVVALLALVLGAVSAGVGQIRLEEATRSAARMLARGESPDRVAVVLRERAGDGVSLRIGDSGDSVHVAARLPGPGVLAGFLELSAEVTARKEDANESPAGSSW